MYFLGDSSYGAVCKNNETVFMKILLLKVTHLTAIPLCLHVMTKRVCTSLEVQVGVMAVMY